MKNLNIALLFLLLLGAGCVQTSSPAEDTVQDPADAVLVQPQPEPSAAPSAQQGVYGHSVWLARSPDGESWSLDDEVLIEHASVPNITRFETAVGEFEAGTLMIVYVDATQMANNENGTERTGRYVSTDAGETWEDMGPVTYVGDEGHVPVDPNLVQLSDGTLRMYYYDFSSSVGGANKTSHFYAADSKDGETFTVVGEVFSGERLTDPEVIFYQEKSYLFYAFQDEDEGGIRVAVGDEDGLSFTQTDASGNLQGIPGVIEVDGELRLFGCVIDEGIAYYTADESLEFEEPVSIGSAFQGGFCDPDPVELEDGSFLLVVKKLPEPTRS